MGYDRVRLYTLTPDRQMMICQAQAGMTNGFTGSIRDASNDPFLELLLRNPRPQVFHYQPGQPHPFDETDEGDAVREWACIPLLIHGRVIGKLSVDNKYSGQPLIPERLEVVSSLAATAIENANRYLELKQQLASEANIHQLANFILRVSTLGNCDETLHLIAQSTPEALGCDAMTLYAYDEPNDKLDYPPKTAGLYHPEKTRELPKMLDDSIVYRMLHRDEPHIVERIGDDELFKGRRFTREEKIASLVAAPLAFAGRRTGVIFFNYRTEHRFREDEISNLRMFADLAAVAIHNAQLFDEKVAKLREQGILAGLSQELLKTISAGETARCAVEVARSALRTEFASIVLIKDSDLVTFETAGWEDSIARSYKPGNGASSHAGYTTLQQAPVKVRDYATETRFQPPLIVFENEIKSGLSAPITLGNAIKGAILVQTTSTRDFNQEEETLLCLIANQISIALERGRHYAELKAAQEKIVARDTLAWMGMVNNYRWHEISNSIATIGVQIEALKGIANQFGRRVPDWVTPYLERIETETIRIKQTQITPPLAADPVFEYVSINTVISERLCRLWNNSTYGDVTLAGIPDPGFAWIVRINQEWLRIMLDILVDNAVEAVRQVPLDRRVISVQTRIADGEVEIAVIDRGNGIPESVQKQLFKGKLEKPAKSRGLGVGLMMAQLIAEQYGGSVRIGSTGDWGTEMIIRLPLAN
jgi:GAF domain-containing protein